MAQSTIIIKSYNGGLCIHMDPEADIEQIKADLSAKLTESAAFFKDATVAISFEGRDIDSQTEIDLINVITSSSSLKVACVAGKNKLTQELIINALNEVEYKSESNIDTSVQIVRGTVKDSTIVDVPGSLLILGDVYPGSSVIAGGDIYVLGALRGQAYAGNNGDPDRCICALDMNPEKLRIAGIRYKPDIKPKWTLKSKNTAVPKMARLVDTEITFSTIDANFWKNYTYGYKQEE
ncbi:MAG: septum site-determining protein MinC [Lachnospiraceae bacterium]|nr:septum site-determining protein MinC [Lachnospiraceae bacterium]